SLQSTDGLNLTLANITAANLTTLTTKGKGPFIVNATGFQGTATLTIAQNSTGNAVLIGGAGSNSLTNQGTGFNILIGGAGLTTDTGNGNDILVSGTTDYDVNAAALKALLAEWSGPDSYVTRINKINILGVSGFKLNKTTVHSNGKANTLTDSGAQPV